MERWSDACLHGGKVILAPLGMLAEWTLSCVS